MPSKTAKQGKLDEIAPFCEIDNYYFQCDMLKNFATFAPEKESPITEDKGNKRRLDKSKRKLATKMMLTELKSMK